MTNQREKFEAWMHENKPTFSLSINSSKQNQYNYVSTNYLWTGWQAAIVACSKMENATALTAQAQNHIPSVGKMAQAINALAAQTGESAESIIEWLTDKGGLTQLMLSHFGGMSTPAQKQPAKLDTLELREFLGCMQNGEMTVSRGLELIDLWLYGKYSNDILPDYSKRPTLVEQLANTMQMHADMTAKYIALTKSQAQQEIQWISVEERLPAFGQIVDLSINGVLQNETYEIDATDNDLYLTHFWTRDGLDDGLDIEQGQFWRARLPMPKSLPPAPEGEQE